MLLPWIHCGGDLCRLGLGRALCKRFFQPGTQTQQHSRVKKNGPLSQGSYSPSVIQKDYCVYILLLSAFSKFWLYITAYWLTKLKMSFCFGSLFVKYFKKGLGFFWPAGTLSQLASKELNFCKKITPACAQQTGCGPLVPLQSSIHSTWEQRAMVQNTKIQYKQKAD